MESGEERNSALADVFLCVVCPMANEAETAQRFVDEVLEQCNGTRATVLIAVLDRASTDNTRELLEEHARNEPRLRVIWAPENRSVAEAYIRGYREALALQPDWILEIDAGFSHQPNEIPRLLAKMTEGYDCVFGSRFCDGGSISESSFSRYWLSYGGTLVSNVLLGTKLRDMTSGFQLFTRAALQMILHRGIQSRGPFFQTEMKTYCRNLRVVEVPISYRAASHGVRGAALGDAWRNLSRLFRMRLAGTL